jgi:hypothetical protein
MAVERTPEVIKACQVGGTSYLPDDTRVELELLDERRFSSGVVFLRYRRR